MKNPLFVFFFFLFFRIRAVVFRVRTAPKYVRKLSVVRRSKYVVPRTSVSTASRVGKSYGRTTGGEGDGVKKKTTEEKTLVFFFSTPNDKRHGRARAIGRPFTCVFFFQVRGPPTETVARMTRGENCVGMSHSPESPTTVRYIIII